MNGRWYVLDVNPEPWRVGPITIARNTKTGKMFPKVGMDQQLAAFQDAVREVIEDAVTKIDGEVHLKFFFWRRRDTYEGKTAKITKHQVDATNMQKATEDALQGLVMDNDSMVHRITSTIVEQGTDVTPRIVIFAEAWKAFDPSEIPEEVWERIDQAPTLLEEDSNVWPPRA